MRLNILTRRQRLYIGFGAAILFCTAAQASEKGQKFFDEQVLPKLVENGCQGCHASGYLRPRVLEYNEVRPYLGMGYSAENNVLVTQLANHRSISKDRPSHPGGQRCASSNTDPCRTIMQWWKIEFGKSVR